MKIQRIVKENKELQTPHISTILWTAMTLAYTRGAILEDLTNIRLYVIVYTTDKNLRNEWRRKKMAKKMTNAEKYREVFGFDPDIMGCPTFIGTQCPVKGERANCNGDMLSKWWTSEYKETANAQS